MTPNDALKLTIDMADEILTTYLSDMDDADLMVRSVPGANHIAWQLGHLVSSEQSMLTGAGFSMPDLPDGFAESYTKETSTSDDATKFHKKDEYLKLMAEQRTATLAALARVAQFGKIRGNFRGETGCESAVALSSGVVRISNPVVVRT